MPNSLLDCIGHTPLVALEHISRDLPVPIFAKCEHLNPGGSIKDRIAKSIILDAEQRGVLRPGMTLIEATAGNTGIGLALIAASKGYGLVCVMPEKMSADKREALKALGAEVVITPNAPPHSPDHFKNVAERLAQERGLFLTDQFRNPANVKVHEETTGPEILSQTQGQIGAFTAGAGTGGTITGVARALRQAQCKASIVLADPAGSVLAGWIETGIKGADHAYAIEGIGSSEPPELLDKNLIHSALSIPDEESFDVTRRLWKQEGMLVGGSSGTNVAAAIRLAKRGDIHGPIVTILADSWDRYWQKPWTRL